MRASALSKLGPRSCVLICCRYLSFRLNPWVANLQSMALQNQRRTSRWIDWLCLTKSFCSPNPLSHCGHWKRLTELWEAFRIDWKRGIWSFASLTNGKIPVAGVLYWWCVPHGMFMQFSILVQCKDSGGDGIKIFPSVDPVGDVPAIELSLLSYKELSAETFSSDMWRAEWCPSPFVQEISVSLPRGNGDSGMTEGMDCHGKSSPKPSPKPSIFQSVLIGSQASLPSWVSPCLCCESPVKGSSMDGLGAHRKWFPSAIEAGLWDRLTTVRRWRTHKTGWWRGTSERAGRLKSGFLNLEIRKDERTPLKLELWLDHSFNLSWKERKKYN